MTVVEINDDVGAIFDGGVGDDELADLRARYWWFAITRTRAGWSAAPLWSLDEPGERLSAGTAGDLETLLRQRVAALIVFNRTS